MIYTRIYQIARLIEGNTIFCPLTSIFNTLVTPCSKLPSIANAKSVLLAALAACSSAVNPIGRTISDGRLGPLLTTSVWVMFDSQYTSILLLSVGCEETSFQFTQNIHMSRKPTLLNPILSSNTWRSQRCWARHDRARDGPRMVRARRPNGRRDDRARAITLELMNVTKIK